MKKANGESSIRQRKKGLWEGRFTEGFDSKGKQVIRSVYGKTKAEVIEKLAQIRIDLNSGTYTKPSELTVSEWFDTWANTYLGAVKESTKAQYKYQIRMNIKPYIGNIKLQKLTSVQLQKLYNDLQTEHSGKKALSAKSIKNLHGVIHSALDQALKIQYIKINPALACTLPRIEKKEMKTITGDILPAFLNTIKFDQFGDLYLVDIFTGMRQAEIIGLSWDCIDFDKKTIYIYRQLRRNHDTGSCEYQFTSLKNGKSRTIYPADIVFDTLKKVKLKQEKNQLKYGSSFANPDKLVFTNEIGDHLSSVTVYNHLKRLLSACGAEDIRFHDLRHTFATLSLQNGDDIKTVSENLGHATVAFTLDVYGHVTEKMKKDSAERMQHLYESVL